MNLQDKVAIVTGAASGLGLATCKTLSAAGARVVGFDRDAGRLAESMGPDMTAVEVDVSDESSIRAGVEAALRKHGALHVAVNCAGVLGPCKTLSKGQLFPLDLWNQVLGVNLTGTFNVIRHAALAMSVNDPDEGGERGVIVNTASMAARIGQMGQAAYSASKAGVIGMTLPIARDLSEHGIRVMSIAPGLFESAMSAAMPQKVADGLLEKMLFPRRMGKAAEFAGLVQHIVENRYLNASTIEIDCGSR